MDKEIINVSEGTSEKALISYYHVLLALIAGMVFGAFLLMTVLAGIRDSNRFDYLYGGWIIPNDEVCVGAPHSLSFYDDYVDVGFEGQDLIRCKYKVERDKYTDEVTIFDCNGKDLTFSCKKQWLLHTRGDIETLYHAAG